MIRNCPTRNIAGAEAHEIAHTLIPWHGNSAFGDNRHTLSPECRRRIESEANFAAGRLLFLGDRFGDEARSREPSIDTVLELHRLFGNSITTTLYRLVESASRGRPIVGLITRHPIAELADEHLEQATRREHFVRSPAFARNFKGVREDELFEHIAAYCKRDHWGGPLGESELVLADDNGVRQRFHFETFFNHYDALTLGVHVGIAPVKVGGQPLNAAAASHHPYPDAKAGEDAKEPLLNDLQRTMFGIRIQIDSWRSEGVGTDFQRRFGYFPGSPSPPLSLLAVDLGRGVILV